MSCSFWHFRYQSQTLQNAIAMWVALQWHNYHHSKQPQKIYDIDVTYIALYICFQWDKKHYLFFIILNLWYRVRWHLTALYADDK